jgi:hypothetical protein
MLAVLPPDYFPRLPVMALVQAADRVVLADTLPYRRRSFQSRARLRNPNGWQWISLPLTAHPAGTPIARVGLDPDAPDLAKHARAFAYNYRTTPYFEFFEDRFLPLFDQPWRRLGPLTCTTTELLADLMGLDTPLVRASALDGAPATPDALAAALGADAVLALATPPARRKDARRDARPARAIATHALHFTHPTTYHQNFDGFEPGLSAADLLFNYGPEARTMLAEHSTVEVAR